MTALGSALVAAAARLGAAGVASPRYDAEALAAHVLGCSRGELARHHQLDPVQSVAYEALVRRRSAREPLQHLTGTAAFRYVEVAVGPGVFIPRPETESVAGWAIDAARSTATARPPVVVDLCTGSGAIALALVTEVPAARVYAVELDQQAYGWAQRNLAGTGVHLHLGAVAAVASDFPELVRTVDVVVANPPYIPHEAWESVEPEVRDHDPALALWAADDGLSVVREVASTARELLRPGGVLVVEHADVQGAAVVELLVAMSVWTQVADHPDLAGRSRFTTARRASRVATAEAPARAVR